MSRTGTKIAGVVALFAFVIASGALGAHWWIGSHAALPGLEGCRIMRDTNARISCYAKEFDESTGDGSPITFLRTLRPTGAFEDDCHNASHIFARPYVSTMQLPDVLTQLDAGAGDENECVYGFVHEFIKGAAMASPEGMELAVRACAMRPTGAQVRTCEHGLGHAALTSRKQITAASQVCQQLTRPYDCMNGVYMQNATNTGGGEGQSAAADPRKLCGAWRQPDAIAMCYQFAEGTRALAGKGPKATFDFCAVAAGVPATGRLGCALAIGSTGFVERLPLCDSASRGMALYCAYGVASGLHAYGESWNDIEQSCVKRGSDIAFACAAGYGQVVAQLALPGRVRADVAYMCGSGPNPDLVAACTAGGLDCWPWIPFRRLPTAACNAAAIPPDLHAFAARRGGARVGEAFGSAKAQGMGDGNRAPSP